MLQVVLLFKLRARNSGISLADASALMAYNARFSFNDFPPTFPTFYRLSTVILCSL